MTGRHRSPRHLPGFAVVAGLVAVAALVAAGWGGYVLLRKPSCSGSVALTVAAAPEIAPAVAASATRWNESAAGCVSVAVTAAEPADVAAALAASGGGVLPGLGQASGGTRVPDVWIPDSSMWLLRLRQLDPDLVPAAAPSIASSPVVLAVPQPVAAQLGWTGKAVPWSAVLGRLTSGTGLKAGIVEPARDASGLSGLVALASAASTPGGQAATVAALRALATNRSTLRADLLRRFPRSTDAAAMAGGLAAAPLPEEAVLGYNATEPPVPLAAVSLDPAPLALDYPYVVLPGRAAGQANAARGLLSALSGGAYQEHLRRQELRPPTAPGASAAPGPGGDPATPRPTGGSATPALTGGSADDPTADAASAISQALSTWSAATQPGRMLAVLDVSGSMLTPVPSAGGLTREQVTIQAAEAGLQLFGDDWSVGLWTFSTELDGDLPYQKLSDIGPLATRRAPLAAALAGIKPKSNGDTGLYDTVLAAYRTVQQGWDPSRVNSVVVMTDGQNDNPGGLTLDELLGQLRKIVDPAKRIQVIAIGIGEASKAELEKITSVTGGAAFTTDDPSTIGQIFLQAIASRPGTSG